MRFYFYSDLTIDWDGTSGNRVVVGAYYMDGGVETVGVSKQTDY